MHPPVPPLPRPQAERSEHSHVPNAPTFSQTSSHGVVRGHRGAFEPNARRRSRSPHRTGHPVGVMMGAPSSRRFPCPSWVSPMPSIHGPRIATIRWFARLVGDLPPAAAGRWGVLRMGAGMRRGERGGHVILRATSRMWSSSSMIRATSSSISPTMSGPVARASPDPSHAPWADSDAAPWRGRDRGPSRALSAQYRKSVHCRPASTPPG